MSTPRRSHSPQVIDLTFLTEEEEIKLRAVLEEDLKLQQDEENRLKYFTFPDYFFVDNNLQVVEGQYYTGVDQTCYDAAW